METLKLILTALALLLSLVIRAQDNASLLYEISGNDLEQPSYLFGTIHLMCPEDIQISETMRNKLNASEQLVLELDFDEPGFMQEMQQKMMLPEGQTIRDLLSEEDYTTVSQFFKDSLAMPMQVLERYNPIALYGVIVMQVLECQPGSYESSLVQLAQADSQAVVGLETIDEQVAALDRISREEQVDYLTEAVEDYRETTEEFQALVAAYQAQHADQLYTLMKETMDEVEGMEQHVLVDRNEKWVPKIAALIKEQPTFVAVGAGHLGGEHGLLALLREQGYTVTAVR